MDLYEAMQIQNRRLQERKERVYIVQHKRHRSFTVAGQHNIGLALGQGWEIHTFDHPKLLDWMPQILNNFSEISIYGDFRQVGHA